MLTAITQEVSQRMECRGLEIIAEFTRQVKFSSPEAALNQECAKLNAALQQALLQALLWEETPAGALETA